MYIIDIWAMLLVFAVQNITSHKELCQKFEILFSVIATKYEKINGE